MQALVDELLRTAAEEEENGYSKGHVLGSGVKDPYAADMSCSGASCRGFYERAAVIAAAAGELQTSTAQKDAVDGQ